MHALARTAGRFLLLALAQAAVLAAVPAVSSAASLPPQGVYEGCAPGTSATSLQLCVDRLRTIREAGFVIVLDYSGLYGSPEQVRAYARAADRLGIRMIWPLHHPALYTQPDVSATYPAMAAACGCSSPRELVPFMVDVVKRSPATFMYYVGDETPLERHDAMAANSRLVAQADPLHPRFYVSAENANFGANLEPFAGDAEVLAGDVYPVGASNRLDDVAFATRAVQRIADAHRRGAGMVLQSFSWGPDYAPAPERWPTVDEYRTMRDLALTNGRPQFILWWAAYVISRSGAPELRWRELVQGAMAPAPTPPRLPVSSARPVAAGRTGGVPKVRRLRVRWRGRVARVRFALTSAATTAITARSRRRRGRRIVQGRVQPRTVKLRLGSGVRRATVRVKPIGGRAARVHVHRRGV